jgi:hypothetical protein
MVELQLPKLMVRVRFPSSAPAGRSGADTCGVSDPDDVASTTGTLADSRATTRLDTFLFASAATVLITRTYLKLTNYPQVGGHSNLHIAHVLWGGLLLGIAMTIMMVSVGSIAKFWASLIGGIGFGLFIDEIGKFLTKDVDYFFKPATAIIYGVLLTAYLIGREVLHRVKLTGPRTRALVAIGIADNELGQLTTARRDTLRLLLATYSGDGSDTQLRALLDASPSRPKRTSEEWAATIIERTRRLATGAARRVWVQRLVFAVVIIEVVISLVEIAFVIVAVWLTNIDSSHISVSDLADFAGEVVQTVLLGSGLLMLAMRHWRSGLRMIRMGLFVALMFTTLMEFEDQKVHALIDFAVYVVLFAIIGAAAESARNTVLMSSGDGSSSKDGTGKDVGRLDTLTA